MKSISLQEHIAQSKIAVAANKAKGNRHGQLLSMLYSDPFHFIEELLQNAEDAIARRKKPEETGFVKIVSSETGIDFLHNGDPFDERDLMAVTTFASTTKKGLPDINQIGKFGIGFRSVYGITDSPEIHSGSHHYRIIDFEIPESVEIENEIGFTTLIRLPFKKNLNREFLANLRWELLNLDSSFLLFLQQISHIEISDGYETVVLSAATEKYENQLLAKTIYTSRGGEQIQKRFLLFHKKAGKLGEVAIAVSISDLGEFLPSGSRKVSVYFPTQFRIEHDILIHGRFTTTPNRENIPFSASHTPENEKLLLELSALTKSMFRLLMRSSKLNAGFFALFSWSDNMRDPISATIRSELDAFIRDEKCLTGASGKFFCVTDLCLAEDEGLLRLIGKKDIALVFHRFDFLDRELLEQEQFVNYLRKTHKLRLADIDTLAFYIANNPQFLQRKPIDFFAQLYKILALYPRFWDLKHKGRYYNLRFSRIIPDHRKNILPPFGASGQPAIFIGKPSMGISTVHPELTADADCLNFFRMLGIPETAPGISEAERLLQKFNPVSVNAWWLKLYKLYSEGDETLRMRIVSKLEQIDCVPVVLNSNGEKQFCKPSAAYLQNPLLDKFLTFYPAFFVSNKLFQYFSAQGVGYNELSLFLRRAGVSDSIKLIPIDTQLSESERATLREGQEVFPLVRESMNDYTIEGLDSFLSHLTIAASAALWQMLGSIPENYREASYVFESYVRSETSLFTPHFLNLLRDSQWIFSSDTRLVCPNGFRIDEMHRAYSEVRPVSDWFYKKLGLLGADVSSDEKKMLDWLRKRGIGSRELSRLVATTETEVRYIGYNSEFSVVSTNSDMLVTKMSDASLLAQSLSAMFPASKNWYQFLLADKTERLRDYLMKSVYAASKTIQATIESAGIIALYDKDVVLRYVFAGIRPDNGEAVLVNHQWRNLFEKRPERKDVSLFIYNMSDSTCVEVKPTQLSAFLEKEQLVVIHPLNFTER